MEINADTVRLSEVVFDFATYWASAYHQEERAYPGDSREAAALVLEWALEFERIETARDLGFIEQQEGVTIPPSEYEDHPDLRKAWLEGVPQRRGGKRPAARRRHLLRTERGVF